MTLECTVRSMEREELAVAIDLAADEGWNPGLSDADAFHAADAGAFLLAEIGTGDARRVVGCISAVSYAGRFGFIGFYIVRPEHRGRGYGITLWNAGMARLTGQVVGLDGVVDQQANYARSGFVLAHRNVRQRGVAVLGPCGTGVRVPGVVDLTATDVPRLLACDEWLFPERRDEFLAAWLSAPDIGAFGFTRDGALVGYTVVRPCREGWKIGPLAAADEHVADALFVTASDHAARTEAAVRGEAAVASPGLYLDVPEVNVGAVELARRHGMEAVFETARMYVGPAPTLDLERTYGISTFELG